MGLAMGRSLKTLGLEVEFPYVPFKGESSSNIVNRARHQGVQIEMSSRLRKGLIQNPKGLKNLAAAIRAALDLRWETK